MNKWRTTKKCPFCAREIHVVAIVCQYCGREIPPKAMLQKDRHGSTILLALLLIVIVLFIIVNIDSGNPILPEFSIPSDYLVDYRVVGSASIAHLIYMNEKGKTEQREVIIPWGLRFESYSGAFLYLTAQNLGESGAVTCEIWVNKKLEQVATSEGAYKIVECGLHLP